MIRPSPVLLLVCAVSALCPAWAQTYEERALRITGEIFSSHLPFGTVLNPIYAAPDSDSVLTYSRCGDSAIWTGHWLAAEAFRYRVTQSPEALHAAGRALDGLKSLIDVTGSTQVLARCILPAGSPLTAGPRSEERHHGEYTGVLGGVSYYWIGNTSRDQYLGAFFGLSVAHQHLTDGATRSTIAALVTRLLDKLLENDWKIVMPDGRTSTVFWLRPDQELAMLQVGRQVNPARFGARYEDLRRRASGLEAIMAIEAADPHESYFKFNLAAITWYMLIRLEESGSPKLDAYLQAYRMFRRAVDGHGNLHFNVIDRALQGADARRDAESMELLSAWTLRPKRDTWVDLRGKYRACGDDRACDPIPVVDRVRTDFLWQRSPFLLYGGGAGTIESAGIDFILPYWMGRSYGLDFNLLAVSAASGEAALAPDSIATLYGAGFDTAASIDVRDASGLTRRARVFYNGASQINFLVPFDTASGAARISVVKPDGSASHSTMAAMQPVAPALFSAGANGKGAVAATAFRIERNGSYTEVPVVRCSGPALCVLQRIDLDERPVYVSLYGTGIRGARGGVSVLLDDEPLQVVYAGPQGQYPGLDQINIRLDESVRTRGERNVTVVADGVRSNVLRILLR